MASDEPGLGIEPHRDNLGKALMEFNA
jgi:hypothetical protein